MSRPSTLLQLIEYARELDHWTSSLQTALPVEDEQVSFIRQASIAFGREIFERTGNRNGGDPLNDVKLRHDLRNHIAVVRGFSDLLLGDEESQEAAGEVLPEILRLSDEVNEILEQGQDKPSSDALFA